MVDVIQGLFFDPPVVVARLGRSSSPVDAYTWGGRVDPHDEGKTIVQPDWTLDVLPDGRVAPRLPSAVTLHDGNGQIRPVAPFLEVWAQLGEPGSAPETWTAEPLTEALLNRFLLTLADVKFSLIAMNGKAGRRANNLGLVFGTYDPVIARGDQHEPRAILGTSPPWLASPLIPRDRTIPLGIFQVIRPSPQPASESVPWADRVRLDVLRVRFTPADGYCYGPPGTDAPRSGAAMGAVLPENSFLNAAAGWAGTLVASTPVSPSDTFDGAENSDLGGPSLGVVDDTCDARLSVSLVGVTASATVFVGPPEFAPDRRPFVSLADELNDRERPVPPAPDADLDRWVEDLFERIFETVSLFNVDRARAGIAMPLSASQRNETPLAGDGLPDNNALGSVDKLRNPTHRIPARTGDLPLPISKYARDRHRALADLQTLRDFVQLNPGRLLGIIRQPFAVEANEAASSPTTGYLATSMQMPPFMRHSNGFPLTLSAWQYNSLMAWIRHAEQALASVVATSGEARARPATLSEPAHSRRDLVLRRRRAGSP